jgi:acetyl-CoA acetyltransferase
MSWLVGSGLTRYGRHEGRGTLDLMTEATELALADAGLARGDVDALVCGYSTTMPHLMLATVFAEHYGLHPRYAHAGAARRRDRLRAGDARPCPGRVGPGEARPRRRRREPDDRAEPRLGDAGAGASGATRSTRCPSARPFPPTTGLVASRYMHEFGSTEADFAALAVTMRSHAMQHEGAQFRTPITVEDVLASRPIASPLKILDCCPVSDGGCAFVVADAAEGPHPVRIAAAAQRHNAQHVSAAASLTEFGAGECAAQALAAAGRTLADVEAAAIYDSFTITLTMLLEEIGLAPRGRAGALAQEGRFDADGAMPLNLHGGLLSYGHCGVAGAMAHLAEMHLQMTGRAGVRQARAPASRCCMATAACCRRT